MSFLIKGGRAAKAFSRFKRKARPTVIKASIVGAATTAGAFADYGKAQPGLRHDAMKEGAASGAILGTAAVLSPKLARKAMKKGTVIFRRIRGRIIPIRKK